MNCLKKAKKSEESKTSLNKGKNQLNKKLSDIKIKYIHNQAGVITFSKNTLLCFIFFIFIWIIVEHLIEIFSFLKDLDFWMVEIIIVSLLNAKMFNLNIYRHQIITLSFNSIPVILKIFAIILSFKDENNQNIYCNNNINYQYDYSCECYNINIFNNNTYNSNFNNENCDDSTGLKNLYVIFSWLVPLGILIYLFLITLRSYINSKLNGLWI